MSQTLSTFSQSQEVLAFSPSTAHVVVLADINSPPAKLKRVTGAATLRLYMNSAVSALMIAQCLAF